jgi:Protein of unknown function DUF262
METQVRTPQMVFMQPQRLVVPLFQRPYVWNEENQWEPLWEDVVRIADRLLNRPLDKHHPHFLGAVVLQQVQRQTGQMQERTIIDGQQRLTTLQLLLDALSAELLSIEALAPAKRIEPLVTNSEPFCSRPEDRFKVWPTNRDRPAFNAVMSAKPPINYGAVGHRGERMVEAHRYFSERAREWLLANGREAAQARAAAIETVVRELLQMVVIDLAVDENAQEIFETLNARGAQLTSADLIKNFIFRGCLKQAPMWSKHTRTIGRSSRLVFGRPKSVLAGYATLAPQFFSTIGSLRVLVRKSSLGRSSIASRDLQMKPVYPCNNCSSKSTSFRAFIVAS